MALGKLLNPQLLPNLWMSLGLGACKLVRGCSAQAGRPAAAHVNLHLHLQPLAGCTLRWWCSTTSMPCASCSTTSGDT